MIVKILIFPLIFAFTNAECPEGSIGWQNSCYSFQSNLTAFPNAELACYQINGNLVSIHDGFTNALLAGQALNIFHESTVVDFWIGLTTLSTPGNWSWTDNTDLNFKAWDPSDAQNQTCSAMIIQNGLWKSDDCYKTKPFVCEVPQVSTTPSPAYLNCSHGWIYFKPTDSCYGKDHIGYMSNSWTAAEQYCKSLGAHLPSLHSFEETKFLSSFYDYAGRVFWTGLYSNDDEVSWKWSDGSSVDYLPWGSGYPNRNASSCVYIVSEQIVDKYCSENWGTVCQKPAPSFL